MSFEVTYPRVVPERRPPNHQPPAPRYTLRWNDPVNSVISDYFAVQSQTMGWTERQVFIDRMRAAFEHLDGPDAHEVLQCEDEAGYADTIVVAYWLDATRQARWSLTSDHRTWFRSADREVEACGYWRETIAVPFDRHETIYSAPNYRIGLARCAGGHIAPITTNGYFGAARDRIPLSAIDRLESPLGKTLPPRLERDTSGKRLRVHAPLNVTAIRSGQYWANAGSEQLADYTDRLQPKLHRGMSFLEENKQETGCLAIRVMSNLSADGQALKETSTLAYFLSLDHLETWAKSHTTHLEIYKHAIAMNRQYGEKREVITWHEVFVLQGAASFEYINCHPGTGLLPYCE